jgi:hypothetical protein
LGLENPRITNNVEELEKLSIAAQKSIKPA